MVGVVMGQKHVVELKQPDRLQQLRWVSSPQSNSSRSPPRRRITGSPRRAVGIEPPVPAKKIDKSIGWPVCQPGVVARCPRSRAERQPLRSVRAIPIV